MAVFQADLFSPQNNNKKACGGCRGQAGVEDGDGRLTRAGNEEAQRRQQLTGMLDQKSKMIRGTGGEKTRARGFTDRNRIIRHRSEVWSRLNNRSDDGQVGLATELLSQPHKLPVHKTGGGVNKKSTL